MKTTQSLPGYRVNEYILALAPHEELWNKIIKVKKEFHDEYNAPTALWGKPLITLVKFSQLEMIEERIANRLKVIAMAHYPFKVELKDFGSFPSHTIYINVTTKVPVQNLVKHVKEMQQVMKMDKDNKPHFIEEPYIPVAVKLVPWQYEKGWLQYSHTNFTGRFIADSLIFLKRTEGEKGFRTLRRFQFMNLPVTTKQGDLFG